MEKLFTHIGISYKINKKFKLGVGLRYAYARKKSLNLTHDLRYDLNLRFKQKLTNISFTLLIFITLLAALVPSWKTLKLNPAEAL